MPTGKKKATTRKTTTGAGIKPVPIEPEQPKDKISGKAIPNGEEMVAGTHDAIAPEHEEAEEKSSEPTSSDASVQEVPAPSEIRNEDVPDAEKEKPTRAKSDTVQIEQVSPGVAVRVESPAGQPAPVTPPAESPAEQPAPAMPLDVSATEQPAPPASIAQPAPPAGSMAQDARAVQAAPGPGGEDDFSLFDSQADLEEIFSAMADVKKEEAATIATAVQAIESGQDATTALQSVSSEVAEKIQKQLEERSAAEESKFVTEEEFIKHAAASTAKTWYHCLYFLTFKSESGSASKKVLYDALKEPLSKSPVDVLPEHMFNFGLSTLIKVQLYDKPVVIFKRGGEFKLDVNRKKMQDLLKQVGPPLSKRPVVTKKEEKKMINDFFSSDKLF
ncbi:MAG: hypothetical protein Q6373_000105 [Candidatus Sigynarchaeota archaeon]